MKINNVSYLFNSLHEWYVTNATKDNFPNFLQKHREAIKVHASCKQSCHQPDCYTEMLTPALLQHSKEGDWKAEGYNNRTHFRIILFQPNQPVITVESKPKLDIIDLLVYLSSCLSFWFGFCPLNVPEIIDQKLTSLRKKRQVHNSSAGMATLRQLKTLLESQIAINASQTRHDLQSVEERFDSAIISLREKEHRLEHE